MTEEKRTGILTVLRYPLPFFGLALLATESAFATVIMTEVGQANIGLLLTLMTVVFAITILAVAFLVWKCPTHIMLMPQKELHQEDSDKVTAKEFEAIKDLLEISSKMSKAVQSRRVDE